jgi:hypothetical protein
MFPTSSLITKVIPFFPLLLFASSLFVSFFLTVVTGWSALPLYIQEVLGSHIGPEAGYYF